MQDQIAALNIIANSDKFDADVREYAKGLSEFLWSFDKIHRQNQKVNEEMNRLYDEMDVSKWR